MTEMIFTKAVQIARERGMTRWTPEAKDGKVCGRGAIGVAVGCLRGYRADVDEDRLADYAAACATADAKVLEMYPELRTLAVSPLAFINDEYSPEDALRVLEKLAAEE